MTTTTQNTQRYAIDPAHSAAEFVIRHMVIAKVRGRFRTLTGTIDVPAGTDIPSAVAVELEVD